MKPATSRRRRKARNRRLERERTKAREAERLLTQVELKFMGVNFSVQAHKAWEHMQWLLDRYARDFGVAIKWTL